jgi:hypothetical protein
MKVLASASVFLAFCRFCNAQSADVLAQEIDETRLRVEYEAQDAEWRLQEAIKAKADADKKKWTLISLQNHDGTWNIEAVKKWLPYALPEERQFREQLLKGFIKSNENRKGQKQK